MKLNRYEAWHFHYIARIRQPFKLWITTKKQGKMLFFDEVMEDGIYDVPEADDNEEFKKWILEERKKNEKGRYADCVGRTRISRAEVLLRLL